MAFWLIGAFQEDGAATLALSPIYLLLAFAFASGLWTAHHLRVVADATGLVIRNASGRRRHLAWSAIEDFRVGEIVARRTRAAVFVIPRVGPMLALDVTKRGAFSAKERAELEGYVRDLRAAARAWGGRSLPADHSRSAASWLGGLLA